MNHPKKQATENPAPEDVHEQREEDQPREGVTEKTDEPAERTKQPTPARPDR